MANQIGKKHFVIVGIITFVLIGMHYIRLLRPVEHALIRISSPLITTISGAVKKIGGGKIYIIQKKEMAAEIERLQKQLRTTQLDTVRRTLLEEENIALREQLNFSIDKNLQPIVAYAVGQTIDNTASSIIIDKGTDHGLKQHSAVVVDNGVLIGTLAKVNPTTAVIRLLNDPQSKVAAAILNKDKSIGLVEGGFGISLRLTTVLQSENLNEDDLIITSGLEESIPRGLLIGSLTGIKKEDYASFQEGVIESAADLSRIDLVGVLVQ